MGHVQKYFKLSSKQATHEITVNYNKSSCDMRNGNSPQQTNIWRLTWHWATKNEMELLRWRYAMLSLWVMYGEILSSKPLLTIKIELNYNVCSVLQVR